jgi:hypothetical protein
MNTKYKILQIVAPTVPMVAVHKDEDGKFAIPVSLWALIEEDNGYQRIMGFSAGEFMDSCEEVGNFIRYEEAEKWGDK